MIAISLEDIQPRPNISKSVKVIKQTTAYAATVCGKIFTQGDGVQLNWIGVDLLNYSHRHVITLLNNGLWGATS